MLERESFETIDRLPKSLAISQLEKNWRSVNFSNEIGIPPSTGHYCYNYLWDSWFIAIVAANFDQPNFSRMQINAALVGIDERGFIPNQRPGEKLRQFDPEQYLFKDRHQGSDYSQPPLLARAAWETCRAFIRQGNPEEGRQFLEEIYQQAKSHYSYFTNLRKNSDDDPLIGCIHPHETGRDYDPSWDEVMERKRITTEMVPPFLRSSLNTAIEYYYGLKATYDLRRNDWDLNKIREVFWVNDVMFNCIVVENLGYMAEIARVLGCFKDKDRFNEQAEKIEQAILTRMWDEETKCFHGFYQQGKRIETISCSNLFPLILPNISPNQLKSILKLLESEQWFNTPYPIPSVPVNSPAYDPNYREKMIWRGPVWVNINWYIVEGLLKQGEIYRDRDSVLANRCNRLAKHIAEKTAEMVYREGCWEFYHPETGKGMRIADFAWSTLGYLLVDKLQKSS